MIRPYAGVDVSWDKAESGLMGALEPHGHGNGPIPLRHYSIVFLGNGHYQGGPTKSF